MTEKMLVRHCSPTLAGLKTGNMFTCEFETREELRDNLRKMNGILCRKGLRLLPLRTGENRALIYMYRPEKLRMDLSDDRVCTMLRERGYDMRRPGRCVARLVERLREEEEFPHEIGFFLGYPPEDVCGFIEKGAEGCKCVGCWKVYGDEKEAQKTFARYKKCTDIYCSQHAAGKPMERLAVGGLG